MLFFIKRFRSQRGSLRGDTTVFNNASGTSPITVPSTTVVYSAAVKLYYGQSFGIQYKAANGSGTANMKIQLEQSNVLPAVEGTSDANWVIGLGVADIETNLADNITHIKSLSPVPSKYGRLKITGLGSNPADAALTASIFQQELVV